MSSFVSRCAHLLVMTVGMVICSLSPAWASVLYLAGGSRMATSDYAYMGAVIPLPGSDVGSGIGVRLWADHLDYSYAAVGHEIDAAGWGGAIAGVYQLSGGWGWSNLSAGVTYRDTRLSAADPGNSQRGAHGYFNLQADGGFNLSQVWRFRGLASYTPATTGYFVQAGFDRTVWNAVRLGIGSTMQGDQSYHQVSGRLTAYMSLWAGVEVDPTIGVSHSGRDTSLYGGIGVVMFVN